MTGYIVLSHRCRTTHETVDVLAVGVGPGRGASLAAGPFPRPALRTRRAAFTAPGAPQVHAAGDGSAAGRDQGAGMFQARPKIALIFLFAMNVCTGAVMPMLQSWFNEQLESGNRATLLSFNSTFQTMGGAVGLLVAGRIADTAGIPFEWQIAGLISLCAAPVYWATRRREVAEVALVGSAK